MPLCLKMEKCKKRSCDGCGRLIVLKLPPVAADACTLEKSSLRFNTAEQVHLCEACKKFYSRYRNKICREKCSCNPDDENMSCRVCRFSRCQAAIEATVDPAILADVQTPSPTNEKFDFSVIPCAVCGCSSSGFHFGVVSCESCKGFFRRASRSHDKFTCQRLGPNGVGKCRAESKCKKCRYQRCLDVGMSLKAISIGRHSIQRRAQIDAAIRHHLARGSFLQEKFNRSNLRNTNKSSLLSTPTSTSTSSSSSSSMSSLTNKSEEQNSVVVLPATKPTVLMLDPEDFLDESSSIKLSPSPLSPPLSPLASYSTISTPLSFLLDDEADLLIHRSVEAASSLSSISTVKIFLDYEMARSTVIAERSKAWEYYMKCVGEYITLLPGIDPVPIADRILLFTQSIFPVTIAQLSLDFDVEKQLPNHFSLDRTGPAWQIEASSANSVWHASVEQFLCTAGNQFVDVITSIEEFSLFCALLVCNPDTPNLSNVAAVRQLRQTYEIALRSYTIKSGKNPESQITKFYQLLILFREATSLFRNMFSDLSMRKDADNFTPLFKQLHAQLLNLPL